MTNQDIVLTITMLVSDRKDTIEKCLSSLSHLREAVPSELIVVDTAGDQACMDIVRRYTDKIVPFAWRDDFSAARNAGVEKAQGQWLMYLDDDEWFESTRELENFFLSGDCQNFSCAAYLVRNYTDLAGSRWKDSRAIRLVRREKETRFIRKVHEQFFPLKSPVCYLNDYVHHYGYAYRSREEKDRHLWRNISLLLEEHREHPEDTQTTAQLIQEYAAGEEYFAAIELCKELWMDANNWDAVVRAQYATFAMGIELRSYISQKRYADGCEAGKGMLAFLEKQSNAVLAKGLVCDLLTELCYQAGKYEETFVYIDRFNDYKKEWDRYPDPNSLDAFSECAVYVSEKEAARLKLLRLHLHVLLKEWEKAEKACAEIEWQAEGLPFPGFIPPDIVRLTANVPYHQAYVSVFHVIYGRKEMRPTLYAAIDKLDLPGKEALLKYLSQIAAEDVKMCSYHLMYAGGQGDKALAASVLEKMGEENYPYFLPDEAYWDSLWKLGVDMNPYMRDINRYRWMEMARRLWDALGVKACEKAYECLARGLSKTDPRYLYVNALLAEKRILEKEKASGLGSAGEIWTDLFQLSQFLVACAATLYKEDVFTGELFSAMPPCYQFGWHIMQAGAVKDQDHSLFLRKVADAAKAYPALKEPCKKLIRES